MRTWASFLTGARAPLGERSETLFRQSKKFLLVHLEMVGLNDGLVDLVGQQPQTGILSQRRSSVADEAALAGERFDDALALALGVRLGDRVAIDAQVLGQRPDRRQQVARLRRPRGDGRLHLVHHLQVDWLAGFVIQLEQHVSLSYDARTVNLVVGRSPAEL